MKNKTSVELYSKGQHPRDLRKQNAMPQKAVSKNATKSKKGSK